MSAGKIRFQTDQRPEMSKLTGTQDRFYTSEESGLGKSCGKMENVRPDCKKWPLLGSD